VRDTETDRRCFELRDRAVRRDLVDLRTAAEQNALVHRVVLHEHDCRRHRQIAQASRRVGGVRIRKRRPGIARGVVRPQAPVAIEEQQAAHLREVLERAAALRALHRRRRDRAPGIAAVAEELHRIGLTKVHVARHRIGGVMSIGVTEARRVRRAALAHTRRPRAGRPCVVRFRVDQKAAAVAGAVRLTDEQDALIDRIPCGLFCVLRHIVGSGATELGRHQHRTAVPAVHASELRPGAGLHRACSRGERTRARNTRRCDQHQRSHCERRAPENRSLHSAPYKPERDL
jgi:hypothetical protein